MFVYVCVSACDGILLEIHNNRSKYKRIERRSHYFVKFRSDKRMAHRVWYERWESNNDALFVIKEKLE